MTLKSDLDIAYKRKVLDKLENTIRAVTLVVDSTLATTTPVKTGRARANWLPSLNAPDTRRVEPGQKADVGVVLSAYKIADTIYISNNLPYIRRLNDGWSKQAPAGFIEMAIMRAKQAVRRK